MEDAKLATQKLANDYADRGDPDGWFEEFYARADGNIKNIYWADLKANPLLVDWIEKHPTHGEQRAAVVGCGLGDDAEVLARHGYQVVAFDISASAIEMCKKRYSESTVDYCVANLFDHPAEWHHRFDLVYECNTIQILTGENRLKALNSIAGLVAPGGKALVSCRSREKGERLNEFPVALDQEEIDGFLRAGLSETYFVAYDDDQEPPVPHFFAVYTRPE